MMADASVSAIPVTPAQLFVDAISTANQCTLMLDLFLIQAETVNVKQRILESLEAELVALKSAVSEFDRRGKELLENFRPPKPTNDSVNALWITHSKEFINAISYHRRRLVKVEQHLTGDSLVEH